MERVKMPPINGKPFLSYAPEHKKSLFGLAISIRRLLPETIYYKYVP
jgi:hypothetical protein